jgi:hypothetical protein
MFQRYSHYLENVENRNEAAEQVRADDAFVVSTEEDAKALVDRELTIRFVDDNAVESFFIADCIFADFPLAAQLKLLEPWVDDEYYWGPGQIQFEVIKLAHLLWPKYMQNYKWRNPPRVFPHAEIFRILESAASHLQKLSVVKTDEEVMEYARQQIRLHRIGGAYPCFHLFGILPLLDDGLQLFEQFALLRYNNAQDCLLFALAQFDMSKSNCLAVVRRVMQAWDSEQVSIRLESGTGILGQLRMVLLVWQSKGFNARLDPVLGPILARHLPQ